MLKKFENILLISDMDGTLLNDQYKLSEENIAAIDYFTSNGGIFSIATGRSKWAVQSFMDVLNINAPMILLNGSLVVEPFNMNTIASYELPDCFIQVLNDLLEKFNDIGIEIVEENNIHIIRENNSILIHKERDKLQMLNTDIGSVPKPWLQAAVLMEPDKIKHVEELLYNYKSEIFRYAYSEPMIINLINSYVSKGYALERLIEILNMKKPFVVSVGDNMNDIELLKCSDFGFAVDNACPELKSIANELCPHHNMSVIQYIISYLERYIIKHKSYSC